MLFYEWEKNGDEMIKEYMMTSYFNHREIKNILITPWTSEDETDPYRAYSMSILATDTDGRGCKMILIIRKLFKYGIGE